MALTKEQVLNAWKDEEYRQSLSPEDQQALPEKPTGADGSELSDEQLEAAAGGATPALVVGGAALGLAAEEAWD